MKKPNLLNKITIIDILIIICVIGAIGFAIYHMADDSSSDASATSFDISTDNKILETYLNYYKSGNKVTSTLVGTDSKTGEKVNLNGDVIWLGETDKEKPNILLDNEGKKLLAGFYKDVPNADVYIDQVSLETNGDKYTNITDFTVAPKNISNMKGIVSGIPNGTEYEISTTLAMNDLDNLKNQKLVNALYNNKRPSIILNEKNLFEINRANDEDIAIANSVFGEFDGQTGEIQIRIYNCTSDDNMEIQSNYNVLKIHKVN